jgi:hypothetical protein
MLNGQAGVGMAGTPTPAFLGWSSVFSWGLRASVGYRSNREDGGQPGLRVLCASFCSSTKGNCIPFTVRRRWVRTRLCTTADITFHHITCSNSWDQSGKKWSEGSISIPGVDWLYLLDTFISHPKMRRRLSTLH